MRKLLYAFPFSVVLLMIFTLNAYSEDNVFSGRYNLFVGDLRSMIPPVLSDFVERYVYERINNDANESETLRRMDFDEVSSTFKMNNSSISRLAKADGICFSLERGKTYTVQWMSGESIIGQLTFPASFNLIMFTNQVKSCADLVNRIKDAAKNSCKYEVSFVGVVPEKTKRPFKRIGNTFYLQHLNSDTYHDSISGHPIWTQEYPSESLANLFVHDRDVADVKAKIEVVAYDGKNTSIVVPVYMLRRFMKELNCDSYFGISELDIKNGKVEALVAYHNPDLAYIHRLEITAKFSELWEADSDAYLEIRLTPYIKLHNLTNLWGDKH